MLDPNEPATPQRTGPASSTASETALADAPAQATDGLNATIARLEQNSREVQEFLDSIEQKISRMEPRLERLHQPAPAANLPADPVTAILDSLPADPLPPIDPPAPPLRYSTADDSADHALEAASLPTGPSQRRRRSDHDDSESGRHSTRRRLASPTSDGATTDDALLWHRFRTAFATLLRSPIAWIVSVSLLLIGALILARLSDTHPHLASSPTAASTSAASPETTASTPRSPAGTASTPPAKPSALVPSGTPDLTGASGQPAPGAAQPTTTADTSTAAPLDTGLSSPADPSASSEAPLQNTPVSPSRVFPGKVHVSSGVMAGNLIYSRAPAQPGGFARLFHLAGRVTMEVVIARNGRVQNIHILSGHHLLRGPAKDAVSTWRYRPYLVNGSPVEVATIVSVDFRR